jgi:hypothetical protein
LLGLKFLKMTKIELNFKILEENNLSPNEFVYLSLIFNGLEPLKDLLDSRFSLQQKGFIEAKNDGILITKKTIDLFIKKPSKKEAAKQEDLYEFVEKYRAIFPEKIKSGGRLIKSDSFACIRKMRAFKAKFKQFSEEQILQAAANYINSKKKDNYHMCTCADYFIEKNSASMLASYCENLGKGNVEVKSQLGNTQSI